jgi:drug/metabolite transporter (DMT)-like permease
LAAVAQLSVPLLAALGGAVLPGEVPSLRFWLAALLVLCWAPSPSRCAGAADRV